MMKNKNKNFRWTVCFCFAWTVSSQADILTDGTVGDVYYLFGDNMIIPQSYGTTVGNNLFHSFSMFNIYNGEAVTFTGANNLENVIARVTGGDASMINGILSSNIGKANFYFINPAGVTFGKNAVVDVPAAFHVSTANQINFSDGSVYSATNPAASTLTIAKPESFGFLGQTGDIVLDGAQIIAKPNQTIDLVANNITLKNEADLYAPAGEVRLVATKGSENVSLVRDENGFLPMPKQTPNSENAGSIMVNDSVIDVTGNSGGHVSLWANNVLFNASILSADNDGALNAGTGKGIDITAHNMTVDAKGNTGWITASAKGSGKAANVRISVAGELSVINNGIISSSAFADGNAGNVQIKANNILVDGQHAGFAMISSDAYGPGHGNAGTVSITGNKLTVTNLGQIGGNSGDNANGNSGEVYINASDVTVDRGLILSEAYNQSGSTHGGLINIVADKLTLENHGQISTNTYNHGQGGDITIHAKETMVNNGYISSDAFKGSTGNAGTITITGDKLTVMNEGMISSNVLENASGDGGFINIDVGEVNINNLGLIMSHTLGNGNAGNITVKANKFSLSNGAFIEADTFNSGQGGNITLTANDILIDGQGNFSGILNDSVGSGNAGTTNIYGKKFTITNKGLISNEAHFTGNAGYININVGEININNQSLITSNAYGSSNAGKINIIANTINMINGGTISTESLATNAGNITINAKDYLYLENSHITTTTNGTISNGGDININSPVLVMNTGLIQANAEGGHGGDINLNLQALIPSYNSLIVGGAQVPWQPYIPGFNVIQAASETGVNGAVNISSPQFDISGSISGLKTKSLEPPAMNRSPCNLGGSSLKRKGKGGFPRNETELEFIPPVTELPNSSGSPINDKPASSIQPTNEKQPCTAI